MIDKIEMRLFMDDEKLSILRSDDGVILEISDSTAGFYTHLTSTELDTLISSLKQFVDENN